MNKSFKVILVDGMVGDEPITVAEETTELASLDAELVVAGYTCEDEIIAGAGDADIILTFGAPMTRRVIEHLPQCQAIIRYGIGYDTVDVEAATDNDVLLINIPDFCFEEVSNHAIVLLLVCAKKIVQLNDILRRGDWKGAKGAQFPMGPIHGQILGIIGCGNIGRMTGTKARCFGLRVLGYDPYADSSLVREAGIELEDLPDLLKKSDYISIHTALTRETFHLLGEERFNLMKPTAYLINTARGPIIDEPAMIKALQNNRIAGAGLDVFEKEPVDPDNPLLKMSNVVVLPHSASYSDAAFTRLRQCVGREAARVLAGKWPKNVVNKTCRPKKDLVRE